MLVWGDEDKVVPPVYAERFSQRIKGRTTIRKVARAGHLAELDQPQQVARHVLDFVAQAA